MQGFTYTELRNALQSWPNDTAQEYTEDLDRIIQLGELQLIKDLELNIFDVSDTATVTNGSRLVTKPDGCLSTVSMFLVLSGNRTQLLQRQLEWCKSYAPNESTDTGTAKYYAELDDSTWYLAKTPNANGTVDVRFVKRPESIVDADNTWLGDNCGELLFMCCLCNAERWIKADDRFADMQADYITALQAWKAENFNLLRKAMAIPPPVQTPQQTPAQ